MKTKKESKAGKFIIVIFLTLLIWVWADLALEGQFSVSNAGVAVDKSVSPNLWVSFGGEPSFNLESVTLKGPSSNVASVQRKMSEGDLKIEFYFDPVGEGMTEPGEYNLELLSFLKKSPQITKLGLTVDSCEPRALEVDIVRLLKRMVPVVCVDEDGVPVKSATADPGQVEMPVPEGWSGQAEVVLSEREIKQAGINAIEKRPFVEFAAGQHREAERTIRVVTSPEEVTLEASIITGATLGYSMTVNIQGKYKIEVLNLEEIIQTIQIKAKPEARRAYENLRYQVILEIDDADVAQGGEIYREVIYNFPDEFVRRDEIVLDQPAVKAEFKLTPLN